MRDLKPHGEFSRGLTNSFWKSKISLEVQRRQFHDMYFHKVQLHLSPSQRVVTFWKGDTSGIVSSHFHVTLWLSIEFQLSPNLVRAFLRDFKSHREFSCGLTKFKLHSERQSLIIKWQGDKSTKLDVTSRHPDSLKWHFIENPKWLRISCFRNSRVTFRY